MQGQYYVQHDNLADDFHGIVAMPSFNPIRLKIISVYCKYLSRAKDFGGNNQRRIGKIHRMVFVSLHELERSLERSIIKIPDRQPAHPDKLA